MVLCALLLFSSLFGRSWQDLKEPNIFSMYTVNRKEKGLEFTKVDAYSEIISEGCPEHLYVLFHGFKGSVNATENEVMANAIFDLGEKSVLAVDYKEAVSEPYVDAVKASLTISEKVALFFSTSCSQLRFVGLSLGAQVAGMTAHLLKLNYIINVERIIGLDPAFPLYSDMDTIYRLDPEDATFVMVVHTAGNEMGFLDPIGHVDFYPNGGVNPQPQCSSRRKHSVYDVLAQLFCSHLASLSYISESASSGGFLATKCTSWSDFKNGLCDDWETVRLGLDTPSNVRGKFFLRTMNKPPFSMTQESYALEELEYSAARSSASKKDEYGPFTSLLILMAQFFSFWFIYKYYPFQ